MKEKEIALLSLSLSPFFSLQPLQLGARYYVGTQHRMPLKSPMRIARLHVVVVVLVVHFVHALMHVYTHTILVFFSNCFLSLGTRYILLIYVCFVSLGSMSLYFNTPPPPPPPPPPTYSLTIENNHNIKIHHHHHHHNQRPATPTPLRFIIFFSFPGTQRASAVSLPNPSKHSPASPKSSIIESRQRVVYEITRVLSPLEAILCLSSRVHGDIVNVFVSISLNSRTASESR